jgi:hypothetical protein
MILTKTTGCLISFQNNTFFILANKNYLTTLDPYIFPNPPSCSPSRGQHPVPNSENGPLTINMPEPDECTINMKINIRYNCKNL